MDETKLRLHAPNLEYFWCGDYLIREYTIVEELSRLDFVAVYFEPEGKDRFVPLEDLNIVEEEREEYLRRATSVVKAVCCASKLRLNAWMLLAAFEPHVVLDQHLQFHNLKYLEVNTWLSRDCVFAIIELMRISPKIENCFLHIIEDSVSEQLLNCDEGIFTSANVVSEEGQWFPKQCILNHLKVIEIHNVIGCMNEFKVLEIILKNAIILEKMIIWTSAKMSTDRKEGLINFSKAPLRIPRATLNIAILFY
ncbi:hypothetical protein Scep_013291 [Stephania cephalantha]|uniref:FBD domain-containing protein n=1 Tax=Stephania cephalantha TaxID=152367 RepID=A0AAP0P7I3_9MAGN